jgi:hypothetical protein
VLSSLGQNFSLIKNVKTKEKVEEKEDIRKYLTSVEKSIPTLP